MSVQAKVFGLSGPIRGTKVINTDILISQGKGEDRSEERDGYTFNSLGIYAAPTVS